MSRSSSNPTGQREGYARHLALARILLGSGALKEAEEQARAALDAASGDEGTSGALLVLARALLLLGRHEEARDIRGQIPDSTSGTLRSEINLLDAQLLVETAAYQECIDRFAQGLDASATELNDVLTQALVAQCYARLSGIETSRRVLEWIVGEAERQGWREQVADALGNLSLLDMGDGSWGRAEGFLLKAREIYSQLGIAVKHAQATLNVGLLRLWRGRITYGEDSLRDAVRLSVEIGDGRLESSARMDRGLALVRLGRIPEARVELSKALRLARAQRSPRRTAVALEYTGELHLACRNYVRASGALRRALAIANRIAPEGDIVPEVIRRQAEVALGLDNPGEALRLAVDADQRAARSGDRYERATTLRVQGQALRALDDEEAAVSRLREALEILEELGETWERDRVLHLLDEDAPEEVSSAAVADSEPTQSRAEPAPSTGMTSPKQLQLLLRQYGMIGSSRKLLDVMRDVVNISKLDLPVLIQGETGTGKELIAKAIHVVGTGSSKRQVAFNCATCPSELLDAELFGHARGAFTGATVQRLGLVRLAEGGSLFLDEIGELREESQARLLRLLDSGEIRPLGSDHAIRVKVRIIVATHVDLEERIREKRFRRDLYFRLASLRITLPPLRERGRDIRELVRHFTEKVREEKCPGFAGFSESAFRDLESYGWPGNIRQLEGEVSRLAAMSPPGVPVTRWNSPEETGMAPVLLPVDVAVAILRDPLRLRKFLEEEKGTMEGICLRLRISRSQLYRLMKRYGIRREELRDRS